jgi:hypothetical protein
MGSNVIKTRRMKRFEYRIFGCPDLDLKGETLNEFGKEGWELVTHCTVVCPGYDGDSTTVWHYFTFKREVNV